MSLKAGYPLACTFAAVLAISSAGVIDIDRRAYADLRIPPWLVSIFVVLLGLASLAFGVLNPETMALVGLEGTATP